ncbi:MAG: TolC family protein [Bacteroidota bacterium]
MKKHYIAKGRSTRNVLILLFLLFQISCTIKNAPVALKNTVDLPEKFKIVGDSMPLDTVNYQDFFKDTILISLIDTAILFNYDLKVALERIKMAEANIMGRSARLLPEVFAEANFGVTRYGDFTEEGVGNFDTNFSENVKGDRIIPYPVTPTFSLGLGSTWEIDIWNKLKTLEKSAFYNYLASKEGRQLVITQLVANVARLYYGLIEKENEIEIIRKNIELQRQALELVNIQKLAGRVTQLAVNQFRAQLLNSQGLEFAVLQEIFEIENALNLLIGRPYQPISNGPGILNQILPNINRTGVPSDLLLNRPDLKQQEFQLQAANANIYAARAAFYPSLNLNTFLGVDAFKAQLLLNPNSIAFDVLAGLTAPIFNTKRLKANLANVQAKNYTLLYAYEQTTLKAFSEVLINLNGMENAQKLYDFKISQVEELQNAVATANDLFLGGFANYLEVVTAQRNVFEAELELMRARNNQFLYLIELYRSLGGGWRSL